MKCWWIIPIPWRMASAGERIATGSPVEPDLALVGSVQAVEDPHEGALAGAVLAEEGVHLAGADIEVDVVVGEHPGEALGDAAHLQEREPPLHGPLPAWSPSCLASFDRVRSRSSCYCGTVIVPSMISVITFWASALTVAGRACSPG